MTFSIKNKILSLLITILVLSISIIAWYGYKSARDSYVNGALQLEQIQTATFSQKVETSLAQVSNDIKYNANFFALRRLIIWEDLKEKRHIHYWSRTYTAALKDYLINQGSYYKIQVLDENGKTIVSLKYNKITHKVSKETQENSLKSSEIFKHAFALKEGDIYISDMHLSTQNGKIEQPYVPVIQYAMVLVDKNGEKRGVIIMDLFADQVLDMLQSVQLKNRDFMHYYLLNTKGDYLYNSDSMKEFNSDLKNNYSFINDYDATLFNSFKALKSYIVEDKDKIITTHRVYPNIKQSPNNYWYLVSMVDKSKVLSALEEFKTIFFILLFFTLFIAIFIINRYITLLTKPLLGIAQQLSSLSKGEIKREPITYKANDEIGQLLQSTTILTNAIETTITQAESISNGNFSIKVELLSENDALGKALMRMTQRLKEIAEFAHMFAKGEYKLDIVSRGEEDEVGNSLLQMAAYFENISKITESMSKGNLDISYKKQSEKDRLGSALTEMIAYLQDIRKQANAISNNNFDTNIEVKSTHDELGKSLIKMTNILKEN